MQRQIWAGLDDARRPPAPARFPCYYWPPLSLRTFSFFCGLPLPSSSPILPHEGASRPRKALLSCPFLLPLHTLSSAPRGLPCRRRTPNDDVGPLRPATRAAVTAGIPEPVGRGSALLAGTGPPGKTPRPPTSTRQGRDSPLHGYRAGHRKVPLAPRLEQRGVLAARGSPAPPGVRPDGPHFSALPSSLPARPHASHRVRPVKADPARPGAGALGVRPVPRACPPCPPPRRRVSQQDRAGPPRGPCLPARARVPTAGLGEGRQLPTKAPPTSSSNPAAAGPRPCFS